MKAKRRTSENERQHTESSEWRHGLTPQTEKIGLKPGNSRAAMLDTLPVLFSPGRKMSIEITVRMKRMDFTPKHVYGSSQILSVWTAVKKVLKCKMNCEGKEVSRAHCAC